MGVHVLALEEKLGRELARGMYACHHCDNRTCCQPEHLFEGTPSDNVQDMMAKGRWVAPPRRVTVDG